MVFLMLWIAVWVIVGHSVLMGVVFVAVHIKPDARTGSAGGFVLFYGLCTGRDFPRQGKFCAALGVDGEENKEYL